MITLMMAAILSFAPHPVDTYTAKDGKEISYIMFGHGSIAVAYEGKVVYIDPVSSEADYSALPKADVVLVTHAHGDHYDAAAIKALAPKTLICTPEVAEKEPTAKVMRNGESLTIDGWLKVEAVAAHNTEARSNFHPKGRDNGYVLTIGGERIYIAGDSEPQPDMLAQKGMDVAFLAVNQPYTMTPEQAAEVINTIEPEVFYPYHFGGSGQPTDLDKLQKLITTPKTKMIVHPELE